ncbi:hypothetical protein pdam_00024945 [Pocillopora damicornis]|uniref:Uncharacterized protein n=1 Tax=Pocillopora damicornis TaxID=46731 RepID=A0A3M6TM48_POCDA|nr:hypothetical protein pdam_00024945 [Pocillopora damicornis]
MIDPFSGDDDASQSSGRAEALGVGHELLVQDVEMQQGESSKSAEICKKLNTAAIISGNSYSKFAFMSKAPSLNIISSNTFAGLQKHCAAPVFKEMWNKMNSIVVGILEKYGDLCLCGAERIDDIVNHFWFCCQSCEGSVDKLKQNWCGVLQHVCCEHQWAGGACSHSTNDAGTGEKHCLKKSSKVVAALRKVVLDKQWLNNLTFYVQFRLVISLLCKSVNLKSILPSLNFLPPFSIHKHYKWIPLNQDHV